MIKCPGMSVNGGASSNLQAVISRPDGRCLGCQLLLQDYSRYTYLTPVSTGYLTDRTFAKFITNEDTLQENVRQETLFFNVPVRNNNA